LNTEKGRRYLFSPFLIIGEGCIAASVKAIESGCGIEVIGTLRTLATVALRLRKREQGTYAFWVQTVRPL
jgi:hypothetical protein